MLNEEFGKDCDVSQNVGIELEHYRMLCREYQDLGTEGVDKGHLA